jgi:hypothetical protein
MSENKKVNILQLASWIVKATSNNKDFILKPNDLKMLYILMLWEYLSKYHNGRKLTCDEQIYLPETDVIKIIQLFYNSENVAYFNHVFNM